jgi:translation initiation factor IF-1
MDSNKESIEIEGEIKELLPSGTFKVRLISGQEIFGYLAGKLRLNKIRLMVGDKVKVQMSPYDLSKGRIIFRF